jgi:hypothetical protein
MPTSDCDGVDRQARAATNACRVGIVFFCYSMVWTHGPALRLSRQPQDHRSGRPESLHWMESVRLPCVSQSSLARSKRKPAMCTLTVRTIMLLNLCNCGIGLAHHAVARFFEIRVGADGDWNIPAFRRWST